MAASPVNVQVLGDLSWLYFYHAYGEASDHAEGALAAHRRVQHSSYVKLPAGAWLMTQFIRGALYDTLRLPLQLTLPIPHGTDLQLESSRGFDLQLLNVGERGVDLSIPVESFRIQRSRVRLEISAKLIAETSDQFARLLRTIVGIGGVDEVAARVRDEYLRESIVGHAADGGVVEGAVVRVPDLCSATFRFRGGHLPIGDDKGARVTFLSEAWHQLPSTRLAIGQGDLLKSRRALFALLGEKGGVETLQQALAALFKAPKEIDVELLDDVSRMILSTSGAPIRVTFIGPNQRISLEVADVQAFELGPLRLRAPVQLLGLLPDQHCNRLTESQRQFLTDFVEGGPSPLAHVTGFASTSDDNFGPFMPVRAWWSTKRRRSGAEMVHRADTVMGISPEGDTTRVHRHFVNPVERVSEAAGSRFPQHLAFCDLNFGFRMLDPEFDDPTSREAIASVLKDGASILDIYREVARLIDVGKQLFYPDWLVALARWSAAPRVGTVFVNLARSLPLRNRPGASIDSGEATWDSGDLWAVLRHARVRQPLDAPAVSSRTVVVVSARLLRASGARISHRLSWERAIEETWECVRASPRFAPLIEFGHLVVRFGCVGAVVIGKPTGGAAHEVEAIFDVAARDGFFRDPDQDGRVLGSNSVLVSSILQRICGADLSSLQAYEGLTEAVREGAAAAIPRCQKLFSAGYRIEKVIDTPPDISVDAPTLAFDSVAKVFHP